MVEHVSDSTQLYGDPGQKEVCALIQLGDRKDEVAKAPIIIDTIVLGLFNP